MIKFRVICPKCKNTREVSKTQNIRIKKGESKECRKCNLPPSRTGIKLTQEHKNKISLKNKGRSTRSWTPRGEKSHLWKGGITRENERLRKSIEYKLWRKAVFERDNHICIWCGFKGYVEADHIKPFAYFPELRFAIDNGRTLCKSCHETTDTYKHKAKKYVYIYKK